MAIRLLDFEGLGDQAAVGDYYNGSGGGPAWGISFSANALSLIDADAGGTGSFANEPSPSTVLFFLTGSAARMNCPAGFQVFSFWFSTRLVGATVSAYSEVDGGGTLLGTITLPALGTNGPGDPSGSFVNWDVASIPFEGTAKSVDFGGSANFVAYDDITILTVDPVTTKSVSDQGSGSESINITVESPPPPAPTPPPFTNTIDMPKPTLPLHYVVKVDNEID